MTKRDMIERDYHAGLSVRQLAERYGYTLQSLYVQLPRWNIRLSPEERSRRLAEANRGICRSRAGKPGVWPDCPPELKQDYDTLKRYYGAVEARRRLEGHPHVAV